MALTVAQLVARVTADTSNFYRGMALANSSMIRSGGIISRIAAGAGLATLGMGIMSLKAAGSFQQSMNIFGAVSEATNSQMKAVSAEAIALGKDIHLPNVSAKDAAISMTELAKGGLSVANSMKAAKGTLELGIAANIGFADSASIVARALTAFHLQGSKATQVADLFTAAANKSTASASDIALGFQAASAQFQAGDQDIQGLTTSLTLMANAGIVGSDAGTSLKTMMNRLMAPTKKAKELMSGLGISIYDQAGNMRQMPDLINQFNRGMQGMTKEQKNAALYTIFGSDAIRAARVQLNAGADGWLLMEKRLTKGGEAQKYAEAATKGFNGAIGALGSNLETLAIQLGTAMLPAATKVARAMAEFIGNIDPQKIISFFTEIGHGVKWVYDLVHGSTLLQAILGGLLAGFIAFQIVSSITEAITAAWVVLNAVMAANPFVLIAAALVALGAGLYIAYRRSEEFRNIVDAAFAAVRAAAGHVVEAGKVVAQALQNAYDSASSIVRSIVSVVTGAWNAIHSNTAIWRVISTEVTSAWNIIRAVVTAAVNIVKAVITAAWNLIVTVTQQEWNVLKTIVTNVLGVITGKISAFTAVKNIISALWTAFTTITRTAWNSIKLIVSTALDNIKTVLTTAAANAGALALAIGTAIVQGILNGLQGLGAALKNKIESTLGSVLSHIDIPFHSPPEHAAAEAIGKPLGAGVIAGWLAGTTDLPSKMSATLRNALEAGKRAIDDAQGEYQAAASRLADYVNRAFDAATGAHVTPAQKLLDSLVSKHDAAELKGRLDAAQQDVTDAQDALTAFSTQSFETDEDRVKKGKELWAKYLDAVAGLNKEKADQAYNAQVSNLQRQVAQQTLEFQARRDLQKQHLDDELVDLETALAKHPQKHQFYQNKIIALLNAYGVKYKASGHLLGAAFETGLRESQAGIMAEARKIAEEVAKVLKLHSPAKTGPLSDLDTWWSGLVRTLTSGINLNDLVSGTLGIADGLGNSVGPALATGVGAPAMRSGASVIEHNYYIEGSLIREQDLDDRIREGIRVNSARGRTA